MKGLLNALEDFKISLSRARISKEEQLELQY